MKELINSIWDGNYGKHKDELIEAVNRALNGERAHRYCSFLAASSKPEGKVQLVPGGNRYFNPIT